MTEMSVEDLPEEIRNKAAVASADIPAVVDYFETNETQWVTLPDGVQRVLVKVLNEGERRKYLNKTNREITMNSRTRDMRMQSAIGDDLKELLVISVVDWAVQRGGQPLLFNRHSLEQALDLWPPTVIDVVANKIRDINPWLKGTVEDLPTLREERSDLDRRIAELEAQEAKNSN